MKRGFGLEPPSGVRGPEVYLDFQGIDLSHGTGAVVVKIARNGQIELVVVIYVVNIPLDTGSGMDGRGKADE